MYKWKRPEAHSPPHEMPVQLQEIDPQTIWPPAIDHQVPTLPNKKPIFKEPLAQGILFLGMVAVLVADYLHVRWTIYVSIACVSIFMDVLVVSYLIWKTRRANRESNKNHG